MPRRNPQSSATPPAPGLESHPSAVVRNPVTPRVSLPVVVDTLTSSRMKAFRLCPMYHHLKYDERITPVGDTAEPLRFGKLFHVGLEAWWSSEAQEAERVGGASRLPFALNAVDRARADALAEGADAFEVAKVEVLLEAYDARWSGQPYDVLAVEATFRGPLVHPVTNRRNRRWELEGKIDAIVVDRRDGRVYIVEHKTTSDDLSPGSEYWRRLRLDQQVSTYFEGARFLGHDVAGCIYDVALKPALKPLRATPPEQRKYTSRASRLEDGTVRPPGSLYAGQRDRDESVEEFKQRVRDDIAEHAGSYFARGVVVRLEDEVTAYRWDTWETARLIQESRRYGHFPRNADGCTIWRRLCEFFPICTGEASADDEIMFSRRAAVHPELATDQRGGG